MGDQEILLNKKWFTILFAIIAISILTACGDSVEDDDEVSQDAGIVPDSSSSDFMPISDGLKEYGVWLNVVLPIVRDTHIEGVYF